MAFSIDCVLCGGYAYGNTGDEITLAVAYTDMRKRFESVAALSRKPEFTQWLHPQITVIAQDEIDVRPRYKKIRKLIPSLKSPLYSHRFHQIIEEQIHLGSDWVKAIQSSKMLYLVGGGYLTDLFSLPTMLIPIEVARRANVPVSTAPLGIGPFRDPIQKNLVATTLQGIELCVRDETSMRFCNEMGLTASIREDDGFRVGEILSLNTATSQQPMPYKVGVCVFYQHGGNLSSSDFSKWWLRFLGSLKELIGADAIEGFCFHTQPNAEFFHLINLFQKAGIPATQVMPPQWNFREAVTALSRYHTVVTSRFHAAVSCSVFGIPCFPVASGEYYAAKMGQALRPDMAKRLVNLESHSAEQLAQDIATARNNVL